MFVFVFVEHRCQKLSLIKKGTLLTYLNLFEEMIQKGQTVLAIKLIVKHIFPYPQISQKFSEETSKFLN